MDEPFVSELPGSREGESLLETVLGLSAVTAVCIAGLAITPFALGYAGCQKARCAYHTFKGRTVSRVESEDSFFPRYEIR